MPKADNVDAGLIGLSEAAALLGVSVSTVRRMLDAGRLEGYRTPLGRVCERGSVERERDRRELPGVE